MHDASTNTMIPTFPHPLTRVVADAIILAFLAPIKTAADKSRPQGSSHLELVTFAPVSSSFVAASVPRPLALSPDSACSEPHTLTGPRVRLLSFGRRMTFLPPDSIFPGVFERCFALWRDPNNKLTEIEIYEQVSHLVSRLVLTSTVADSLCGSYDRSRSIATSWSM